MDHQSKNKKQVSIISNGRGGGGIAGLLVFGGALAVTGLIAVASFASSKNKAKAKRPKSPQPQESDDTTHGLPSLLQDSTTHDDNACSPSNETSNVSMDQIDSFKSLSTPTLILEEQLDLKVKTNSEEESATGLHQEIVLSDDSPPESAVSSIKNGNGEESLESSFEIPCFKAEDADKSESEEPPKSIDINEGQYENATTETEEGEDDDDDMAFETSENSTEATGRTSLDSNEAPIWPAEMIEEPQRVVKEGMLNIQSEAGETAKPNMSASESYVSSDGGSDSSECDKAVASQVSSYEKANLYVAQNHQLSVLRSSKSTARIFLQLLLAMLLLLVLLAHRKPEYFYDLDVDADNSEYPHEMFS